MAGKKKPITTTLSKATLKNEELDSLVDVITKKNPMEVKKALSSTDVSLLINTRIAAILLKNFPTPEHAEFLKEIFNSVIDKINISDNSDNLQNLKANCLFQIARIKIEQFAELRKLEVKNKEYTEALNMLEEANAIYSQSKASVMLNSIKDLINNTIYKYHNPQEAWEFAEKSLHYRTEKLEAKSTSILDAIIVVANIGKDIKDHKAEALRYAEKAYNLATELNSREDIVSALKCMVSIYQSFGDTLKARYLSSQLSVFEPVSEVTKGSDQNTKGSAELKPSNASSFVVIKKCGVTTDLELKIKALLQERVLEPISKAAAEAKWFNMQLTGQYGIDGYINEVYLAKMLGELNAPENIKIALSLCFEAISLGIMSSDAKNPLCSAIFVKQFPGLMQEIIQNHPEYFVDGRILQTSMQDASNYSLELLGTSLEANSQYNKYFENGMIPIIEGRFKDSIFQPIADLLKDGSWNKTVEEKILYYLSQEYLSSSKWYFKITGSNHLGQNLNEIPDVINIVRILGFKIITETLRAVGSKNYDPIKSFMVEFPELTSRIASDHADYFHDDPEIKRIYDDISSKNKLSDTEKTIESKVAALIEENTPHVTAVANAKPILEATIEQDLSGEDNLREGVD